MKKIKEIQSKVKLKQEVRNLHWAKSYLNLLGQVKMVICKGNMFRLGIIILEIRSKESI